jgi:hypothetical protein
MQANCIFFLLLEKTTYDKYNIFYITLKEKLKFLTSSYNNLNIKNQLQKCKQLCLCVCYLTEKAYADLFLCNVVHLLVFWEVNYSLATKIAKALSILPSYVIKLSVSYEL